MFSGNDLNIDSIVKAEKAKAMNDLAKPLNMIKTVKNLVVKDVWQLILSTWLLHVFPIILVAT